MGGETNLQTLLQSMAPELIDGEYVFCSFAKDRYGDHAGLEPFAACLEAEGLTLVVPKSRADEKGLEYDTTFRGITLGVHSSLGAVGLTAAVATALAEQSISANVIAGYFHDHIFIQSARAEEAMSILQRLGASAAD